MKEVLSGIAVMIGATIVFAVVIEVGSSKKIRYERRCYKNITFSCNMDTKMCTVVRIGGKEERCMLIEEEEK